MSEEYKVLITTLQKSPHYQEVLENWRSYGSRAGINLAFIHFPLWISKENCSLNSVNYYDNIIISSILACVCPELLMPYYHSIAMKMNGRWQGWQELETSRDTGLGWWIVCKAVQVACSTKRTQGACTFHHPWLRYSISNVLLHL